MKSFDRAAVAGAGRALYNPMLLGAAIAIATSGALIAGSATLIVNTLYPFRFLYAPRTSSDKKPKTVLIMMQDEGERQGNIIPIVRRKCA